MKVWLNGQLLETKHAAVSVTDHGLTVGDGVFETAALRDGVPFALTRHLERLARSAERLGLVPPPRRPAAGGGRAAGRRGRCAGRRTGAAADHPHRRRRRRTGRSGATAGPTVLITVAPGKVWPATRRRRRRAVDPQRERPDRRRQDHVVRGQRRGAGRGPPARRGRGDLRQHPRRAVRGHRQQRLRRHRRAALHAAAELWLPRRHHPRAAAGVDRRRRGDAVDRGARRGRRGVPGVVDPGRPADPPGRRRGAAGRTGSADSGLPRSSPSARPTASTPERVARAGHQSHQRQGQRSGPDQSSRASSASTST